MKVATWEVQIVDAGTEANGLAKGEVVFGTPGGRESYGGIIRDAYAEIRPSSFVENVRFGYRFVDGYGKAKCCRINVRVGVQLRETTARDGCFDPGGFSFPEVLLRTLLLHVARGYSLRETAVQAMWRMDLNCAWRVTVSKSLSRHNDLAGSSQIAAAVSGEGRIADHAAEWLSATGAIHC